MNVLVNFNDGQFAGLTIFGIIVAISCVVGCFVTVAVTYDEDGNVFYGLAAGVVVTVALGIAGAFLAWLLIEMWQSMTGRLILGAVVVYVVIALLSRLAWYWKRGRFVK